MDNEPIFKQIIKTPEVIALETRAEEVANVALFNELANTVRKLMAEIGSMPVASRYSKTAQPYDSIQNGEKMRKLLVNGSLPEAEFKRTQLKNDALKILSELSTLQGKLKDLVMDIETTKMEG